VIPQIKHLYEAGRTPFRPKCTLLFSASVTFPKEAIIHTNVTIYNGIVDIKFNTNKRSTRPQLHTDIVYYLSYFQLLLLL